MNPIDRLENLIEQRFELLGELMRLTDQQDAAITAGHMNELMSLLAQKQRALELLTQQTAELRAIADQCSTPPGISAATKKLQQQCDEMHRELLRRETHSQEELTQRRQQIADELSQNQNAHHAAVRYTQSNFAEEARPSQRLDLSSD